VRQLDGTGLKRLHREWRRRSGGRVGLVLDDVQSPFNVGAIVRTAAAYRVDDVWTAGTTPPLDTPKVGKTALGCERYLQWKEAADAGQAIDGARGLGYQVVGLELADGAAALHELDLTPDVCLVVGAEDHGIRPATLDACDAVGYVPLLGRVGSLNVAAATAIALYELRRRTWTDS
jgi:tRNA (guanosine-2'-O-)-methyltransferase